MIDEHRFTFWGQKKIIRSLKQNCSLVFCFRPYKLCQIDANSFTWSGFTESVSSNYSCWVCKRYFTVKKSKRAFSAIATDQAHEQNNVSVKGDGGVVGLTENPAALHWWVASGVEMAQLLEEFAYSVQKRKNTEFHYLEIHVQITYAQDVKSLKRAISLDFNYSCFFDVSLTRDRLKRQRLLR